ncbi:MAG: ATP-binding protein [Anaerostipes sp.]|jgi:DNA polymerase III delta prime subunit
MSIEYFTLTKIPDITLAQYSAEEGSGVDDIIRQHAIFYRQLNRKGLLFNETYHLIYNYDPGQESGNRMQVIFRVDCREPLVCMEEVMNASPLSRYFQINSVDDEKYKTNPVTFSCQATLAKQDSYMSSSISENKMKYYGVHPWKMNGKARLIGMFRMMQKLNKKVCYVATIRAVDYSNSMKEFFEVQIEYMRNANRMNRGNRDENAENSIKLYNKLFESLRNNPHFHCSISAYADAESIAKLIIDAAASEAVEEGNYKIISENGLFQPLIEARDIKDLCMDDTPRGMRRWNTTFLLKEVVPFGMFPTLYPGETIEIPKESAPVYQNDGLLLGEDTSGYQVYLPLEHLTKHALLAGVPGSGKTHSMLHICSQLAEEKKQIPILVFEPAKKEYRALAKYEGIKDLIVFSPGGTGSFPLRINPFEFPVGVKVSEHITNLIQVFEGAFDLVPPMPFLISSAIEEIYREHDWYPFEVNDGQHDYPDIRELYNKVADLLDKSDYVPEIQGNLKSCLQVRIGSLLTREMGNVFNVSESVLTPEEWMKSNCIIELESMGSDASNFLTLLLLTLIREELRSHPKAPEGKPRHVIFLEEAHNLIGPTTVANAENGDAKVASTKYIVDMLAEVRALGEAIIIADQLPTALASQITKNTSLKIGHKMTAMDDRQLLAATMSADGVQLERMGVFNPGRALCIYEKVQKPFELQMHDYEGEAEPPENIELFQLLAKKSGYQEVMRRDYLIVKKKRSKELAVILRKRAKQEKEVQEYISLYEQSSQIDKVAKRKQEKLINEQSYALAKQWVEYCLKAYEYKNVNLLEQENIIRDAEHDINIMIRGMTNCFAGANEPDSIQVKANAMIRRKMKNVIVQLARTQ